MRYAGSAGTNNKWPAIIADDVRRGRKRFRTNDLFIPARPNGDGGGCGGDDDGETLMMMMAMMIVCVCV